MATVTRPSTPLPDPGDEMDAEQVRDWINNVLTFLESTNIDEANVDLTSTDGIMGKSTAQTMTGKKNFVSTNAAAAGVVEVAEFGLDPASGTAADNDGGRIVFYADDDGGNATDLVNLDWVLTDASNGSEDSEFRIRALKAGTMTEFLTAGATAAGAGRVAVTGDLTVAYDSGEYVTHAVSSAGVYSITTTDASSDSGAITLDTVDSITLDSDTATEGIVYADGGTNLLRISNSSSDVVIKPLVDAKDIIFQQYDGTEVLKVDDDASVKVGGGYGSTGVTISTAGVIQANGAITSDGAVTGSTLAGTISTAAQNSITSASSLATVGTITSGTWSGVIDGTATMTQGSDATGDIYYRNASGHLTRLAAGADGTVLTGTGSGSVPAWESPTTGDITSVVAGVGLSGGGTSGDVTLTLDISELSTVTPADGDFFATLDSDGANEQKTTTTALATLFAGAGMTASSSVLNVIGGDGITANSDDVAITAAQTTITSIYNTSLKMGRDSQNLIDFATTDDKIILRVANVDEVELVANTLQPTTSDGVALGTGSLMWSDLFLADGSVVNFNNGDVTLTHSSNTLTVAGGTFATAALTGTTIDASTDFTIGDTVITDGVITDTSGLSVAAATTVSNTLTVGANTDGHDVKFFGDATGSYMEWDESEEQLRILGPATDAAASSGKLLLATAQTDVRANDILGQIEFQAPLEAQDTDARAIAASIKAIAQDTFTASVNATDLIFYTGHSEAATEKFRFTSQGELGIGGANYGSDGQVLTSTGAGTAPAWENAASSGISWDGSTANGVATYKDGDEATVESNLTFTGSALTCIGTVTVGVDDTGHDVKFFGATSGKYMEWDESSDALNVVGTANARGINVSASGAALASQNVKKVILVDLTDPATMWDVEEFLSRAKWTSWYKGSSGVGAPPMRGAMWIDNAGTSLVWWNLDTDALYISFSAATNKMLKGTSISDLAFLDGKIYAGGTHGITIIDFLSDGGSVHQTGGINTNFSDIVNRNTAVTATVITTGQAIINDTINGVAAVRDPTMVDNFNRPKHWWAVATNSGPSVHSPVNHAVYDHNTTDPDKDVSISPSGILWDDYDHSSDGDTLGAGRSIYGISADFGNQVGIRFKYLGPGWTDPAGTGKVAAFDSPIGSLGGVVVACNQGIGFLHWYGTGSASYGPEASCYFATSTYNTPLMKGTRVGAYPLHDLNDVSGHGNNLTNNGTATQATGPLGANTAYEFNGSDQSLSCADDSTMGDGTQTQLTVSAWVYPDALSGEDSICSRWHSSNTGRRQFNLTTNAGDLGFQVSSGSYSGWGMKLATGKWQHVVGVYDASTSRIWVYLDGVKGQTPYTSYSGVVTDSPGPLVIGGEEDRYNFDGKISQVSVQFAAWTDDEVNLEYQRMVRALAGVDHTLANNSVTSIRVDHNSGLAAVTTAANQTEIWDVMTGMRESIDATTTVTIADADVALKSGADDPEYITGRSGVMEFDGQARRVIG